MKSENPKKGTAVSLKEAKKRINAFRERMKSILNPANDADIPKSIWVPFTDFKQAIDMAKLLYGPDTELSGMRIYLTDEQTPGAPLRITGLVVPTRAVAIGNGAEAVQEDIIVALNNPKGQEGLQDDDGDSSIYDMTIPCPTHCGGSSLG